MSTQVDHEMLAQLNIEALDKVIEAIDKAPPQKIMMAQFEVDLLTNGHPVHGYTLECNTAYCIAGWTAHIFNTQLSAWKISKVLANFDAADGPIMPPQIEELFFMKSLRVRAGYDPLDDFDKLPAQLRKDIVLAVLRKFRATGVADWKTLAAPHMSPLARGIADLYPGANPHA